MANNFTLLRPLHLLLPTCVCTSFCLHVSLEWNIKFVHEISRIKYNAVGKFSAQNIFIRKRIDENFSHELFEIEINANENKANYSIKIFATQQQSCLEDYLHVELSVTCILQYNPAY